MSTKKYMVLSLNLDVGFKKIINFDVGLKIKTNHL
jgi:hypothetical protein